MSESLSAPPKPKKPPMTKRMYSLKKALGVATANKINLPYSEAIPAAASVLESLAFAPRPTPLPREEPLVFRLLKDWMPRERAVASIKIEGSATGLGTKSELPGCKLYLKSSNYLRRN